MTGATLCCLQVAIAVFSSLFFLVAQKKMVKGDSGIQAIFKSSCHGTLEHFCT